VDHLVVGAPYNLRLENPALVGVSREMPGTSNKD
jgi:hypothetical protein